MNERLNLKLVCQSIKNKFVLDKSENGVKIYSSASKILEFIDECSKNCKEIEKFAGIYDFDEFTPANGYRSFLRIFDSFLTLAHKVCSHTNEKYGKIFYSKTQHATEIFVISQMIENLCYIGENLIKMHEIADEGKLFSKRCHPVNLVTQAFNKINQECFYGRFIGFQFVEPLQGFVRNLSLSMAIYSDFYNSDKSFVSKAFMTSIKCKKYIFDPEARATRFVETVKNADIQFFSEFMRLSDSRFIHKIIDLTLKKIQVVKPFEISPGKLGVLSRDKNELIDVPIPKSHIGLQNIKCRLLSGKMRDGMIGMELDCTTFSVEEPSDSIVIHVHGGGWISQCSKSHEVYLREWTTELDVPILSIDYTLAPEATFPRPVEEVLYVYCWVLKNAEMVGTTAKKIILAGDSAGGNIVTAVLIKIIEMNLPKPHGLFVAYTPFLVNYCKSPSRFFGYFDAFLNVTAVMKIFGCYCNGKLLDNQSIEKEIGNEIDDSLKKIICDIPKDYLISPLWCPDEILQQFPPTRAVTSTTDPCLDDCIEFCRRLRNLKIQTKLTVLEGLMHGFLNTVTMCKESHEGSKICIQHIAELFKMD